MTNIDSDIADQEPPGLNLCCFQSQLFSLFELHTNSHMKSIYIDDPCGQDDDFTV